MTDFILPGADNASRCTAKIQEEKKSPFKAKQRAEGTQSFDTVISKTIQHNENHEKAPPSTLSHIQQEIVKLIVMTQYRMKNAFFDVFSESNVGDDSAVDAMNWMVDRAAVYDIDLSMSKNQQFSAPSGSFHLSTEFNPIIDRASESYDVDSALIKAVIRAESNFDPNSTSPKGAMGLMQLMPETAKELGVIDPYHPAENIHAGTRYLKSLLDRYEGNIPLSLAAYNWGMGNVEKPLSRIPQETQNYISRVNQYYQQAKA